MKKALEATWKIARLVVVCAGAALAAPVQAGLVVHEWGTFTSVQGSDGTTLEGLQHEEEFLPAFVHARVPIVLNGNKGLTTPAIHVTQKMETPVIYFHTPAQQHVHVKVDFQHGLLTQWYPRAQVFTPVEEQKPFDVSRISNSTLEWDVELVPRAEGLTENLPAVDREGEDVPWKFARQVDSALVRVTGTNETERFLFYRGLGTFALPVTINATTGGVATVRNSSPDDLPKAFALEVASSGSRYITVGKIPAGQTVRFSLGATSFGETKAVAAALKMKMHDALVQQGLFDDEATAMVNTWSRQWFECPGTRLMYILPREIASAMLPLQITPAPEKLIRVLVGRLEYLTPEVESATIRALHDYTATDEQVRATAAQTLFRAGRFLEPHLLRAQALSLDRLVQHNAAALRKTLQPVANPQSQ